MTAYVIMAGKKRIGFTFNFSTAIMKKRELESQGEKDVRIVEENSERRTI